MSWEQCRAVDRDPDKMGGAWCFAGTRLAVTSLFEHLELGSTVDEFLEWFPVVTRDHVQEVLAFARHSLDQPAKAA
jgi:uncharacterized protein (DUF433 family)